jgi:putative aminopeptidase FrvX
VLQLKYKQEGDVVNMKKTLIELLQIHSPSKKEKKVREHIINIFESEKLVDKYWVDETGNLLAEKTYGEDNVCVLLSSHMDTVKAVKENLEIIDEDGKMYAKDSCAGFDDKVGLTIHLTLLRKLKEGQIKYKGKILVAFSVEEEIGVIGASAVDKQWVQQANLCIIADRRNGTDIVTGCGNAFCSNEVGQFIEDCSAMLNLNYKCVEGGISDALAYSEMGVNSVNLSVGYRNEHTENEHLIYEDMVNTLVLIAQMLTLINDFAHTFGQVPLENKWVEQWSRGYNYYPTTFHNSKYNELAYDDIYFDEYGDITVDDFGDCISLKQSGHEILVSKEIFKQIYKNLN